MTKRIAISTALILMLLAIVSTAQTNGSVDWINRVVKAKGIGAPNPNMPEAAARPAAIRAAQQLALRNALELIKGMNLNSQTTIKNSMVENDVVNTSVNGFVSGFTFEPSPHYMNDGTVEIEVTLPIDGQSGLGGVIFAESSPFSPKQVAPVAAAPKAYTSSPSAAGYTGLIVDARGLGIKPALMPKILSEADREIYGSANISRDFAIQFGMCGYAKTPESAKALTDRIGNNPMVVKAMKVSGANKADIILAKAEADAVQSAAKTSKFLAECRVVVLLD
ncbi:MAG: hypothetical protein JNL74_18085 [Fibrobacteres bacterium]|nr:hypothetical protein [Fibrobacterota bacterium]